MDRPAPASNAPLPPAIEAAYRVLARHGPLSAADLQEYLRSDGFTQSIERLAQLSDRFPRHFHLTTQGLLSVASSKSTDAVDEVQDTPQRSDWYRPTNRSRVPFDRVAVLDIETTGLDRTKDFVWEVALVRLDGEALAHHAVQLPDSMPRPRDDLSTAELPLNDVLRLLEAELADVDLLLGHNLLEFDIPFLQAAAKRAGIEPPQLPSCTDTIHLATLVDVAMPNRSLADLIERFHLGPGVPHRALADAASTAAVVKGLLNEVDLDDPSWQLAIAVLETFDHPLASLP